MPSCASAGVCPSHRSATSPPPPPLSPVSRRVSPALFLLRRVHLFDFAPCHQPGDRETLRHGGGQGPVAQGYLRACCQRGVYTPFSGCLSYVFGAVAAAALSPSSPFVVRDLLANLVCNPFTTSLFRVWCVLIYSCWRQMVVLNSGNQAINSLDV